MECSPFALLLTICVYGVLGILITVEDSSEDRIPSVTKIGGTFARNDKIYAGDLIFEENFDNFDLSKWQHEQTLAGGGNWEFQWYTNNRSISYVENGTLHIRPQLLTDYVGDPKFIYRGHLDINGGSPADACTNPSHWGCSRDGAPNSVLNPIVSARIRTVDSFYFKYGKFEVRAKIPVGDWLWPAVWLLPRYNQYAQWPNSGEIDVLESRGNKNLIQDGKNIGPKLVTSTLHWGLNANMNFFNKTSYKSYDTAGFNEEFHNYQFEWTPEHFIFSVDDKEVGKVEPPEGGFWEMTGLKSFDNPWKGASKMAPFDQEFYIVINLACGGISYFPDDAANPGGKPWTNKSPHASTDFWKGQKQWIPTWDWETDKSHLLVDYIKIWAV